MTYNIRLCEVDRLEKNMDEPKKQLNTGDNPPKCLMDIVDEAMDIVDEAYDLLSDRIDVVRQKFYLSGAESVQNLEELNFLKDLRDLIKLSENFRDE